MSESPQQGFKKGHYTKSASFPNILDDVSNSKASPSIDEEYISSAQRDLFHSRFMSRLSNLAFFLADVLKRGEDDDVQLVE